MGSPHPAPPLQAAAGTPRRLTLPLARVAGALQSRRPGDQGRALGRHLGGQDAAPLMMVAMALSVAQGNLRIDANSWASLATGADEVRGDESSEGARFSSRARMRRT